MPLACPIDRPRRSRWTHPLGAGALLAAVTGCGGGPDEPLCSVDAAFSGLWSEIATVEGSCGAVVSALDMQLTANTEGDLDLERSVGFVLPSSFTFEVGAVHVDLAVTGVFGEVDLSDGIFVREWIGDCVAQLEITEREDTASRTWSADDRRLTGTMTCGPLEPSPESDSQEALQLDGTASFRLLGSTEY